LQEFSSGVCQIHYLKDATVSAKVELVPHRTRTR
jgi:hypothetical protein